MHIFTICHRNFCDDLVFRWIFHFFSPLSLSLCCSFCICPTIMVVVQRWRRYDASYSSLIECIHEQLNTDFCMFVCVCAYSFAGSVCVPLTKVLLRHYLLLLSILWVWLQFLLLYRYLRSEWVCTLRMEWVRIPSIIIFIMVNIHTWEDTKLRRIYSTKKKSGGMLTSKPREEKNSRDNPRKPDPHQFGSLVCFSISRATLIFPFLLWFLLFDHFRKPFYAYSIEIRWLNVRARIKILNDGMKWC